MEVKKKEKLLTYLTCLYNFFMQTNSRKEYVGKSIYFAVGYPKVTL